MKISVSKLIVNFLEHLGIDTIFGMPGAHILPVYDCLYDSVIRSVLVKHEQGAAFMAGGYAKASGNVSACITTAGPGATNLVTGIANAFADKQPILIITGETSTHIFGKGGLQESSGEGGSIDQGALFESITRYHRVVERTDYLPQVLKQAAKILHSAEPGPVLLSIPFNVQKELVDDTFLQQINTRPPIHLCRDDALPVADFIRQIDEAKRPVIVAGYGCLQAGAQRAVSRLSESMHIPVTTSLKGKGAIDEQSPLSLGSLGVTSSGDAYRYIVEMADLIIVLGAGFNERTSYLWDAKLLGNKRIVQVDRDFDQLEKVFTADLAIHGDIKQVLSAVLEQLEAQEVEPKVPQDIQAFHATRNHTQPVAASSFALVERFFIKLADEFPADIQVFDDNIIFAQNFFQVSKENRYFPNSGISSLGHALPAAIGARFSTDKPTFAIMGDGGFQMCCMEIMTAVNYDIPLNVVVFNNATMGLIRKNQFQHYQQRFINCDFTNPDFAHLARSFGIHHKKIDSERDLDDLFDTSDLTGSTNLIEIMLDKNAFPNYISGR